MFLLNHYRSLKPSQFSSYPFLKHIKKTSVLNISSDLNVLENEKLESLKEKILFNTVIDEKRNKLGYFQTRKVLSKRKVIENVQPLPLSLKYLSEDISPSEKNYEVLNTKENEDSKTVQFPFNHSSSILSEVNHKIETSEIKDKPERIDKEVRKRNEDFRRWMNAYENLECDISDDGENKINYGTPDPNSQISDVPCGGCGAFLHCKVSAKWIYTS